ncbi:MAG TPA: hypothetical protein VG866_01125 [Candidatus Paceibacterota bacterium]|nr:hypothetical protein [Candidatus Paceibacterota bacterium]
MSKIDQFLKKAIGAILILIGSVAAGYALLIVSDIFMFWWAYDKMATTLTLHGIDSYLAKIAGVTFTLVIMSLTNKLLVDVIKRKKTIWAPKAALIMVTWFGVMYLASAQYSGSIFDVFSGNARATYYRTSDNVIVKMPLGAKIGPEGQTIHVFDSKTAEEYRKQEEAKEQKKKEAEKQLSSLISSVAATSPGDSVLNKDWNPWKYSPKNNLTFEFEKLKVTPTETVLFVSARRNKPHPDNNDDGKIFPLDAAYLVDDSGTAYHQIKSSLEVNRETSWSWAYRLVLPDEVYRYTLTFPALASRASGLKIHYAAVGADDFKNTVDLKPLLSRIEREDNIVSMMVVDTTFVLSFDMIGKSQYNDTYPVQIVYISPSCPPSLIKPGASESIQVELLIDSEGNVVLVDTPEKMNYRQELLDVISRVTPFWKFKPATRNGNPVEIFLPMEFEFLIENGQPQVKVTSPIPVPAPSYLVPVDK